MNRIVCCYACPEYDVDKILALLETIYAQAQGPELKGKTVLLKPNILMDEAPWKAISTHPTFIEAVIRFLQSRHAGKIFVGDSPALHTNTFKPCKSGIFDVCEKMGAEWVYFGKQTESITLPSGKIPVAKIVQEVDCYFSLPKLKTHELMGYTGAIKNGFGLIPQMHKTKQHAFHRNSRSLASFLIDLNEHITPDFVFMDAITAMEGPGPGNGYPFPLGLILGSTNLLALDVIATKIIGYNPLQIETNREGLERKKWLSSIDDIEIQGTPVEHKDFKLVYKPSMRKMSLNMILNRIPGFRKAERTPVFFEKRCTGCLACVRICSVQALHCSQKNPRKILLERKKCIHCFCCHEVCPSNAIEIR